MKRDAQVTRFLNQCRDFFRGVAIVANWDEAQARRFWEAHNGLSWPDRWELLTGGFEAGRKWAKEISSREVARSRDLQSESAASDAGPNSKASGTASL